MSRRELTFAIGDVHGRLDLLAPLLEEVELLSGGRPYELVFLGDLIDRGPDSAGVITTIRTLQARDPEGVLCLMGNHEEMLVRAIDDRPLAPLWLENGGMNTLASFKARSPDALPSDVVDWVRGLPTFLEDDLRYFVHAGVDPRLPLSRQSDSIRLWIREPFLSRDHDFGKHIVHGHTPVRLKSGRRPAPDERRHRTNLDTGAVFGGALTAAMFDRKVPHPIFFVQILQNGQPFFSVSKLDQPWGLRVEPSLREKTTGRRIAASVVVLALAGSSLAFWAKHRPAHPALGPIDVAGASPATLSTENAGFGAPPSSMAMASLRAPDAPSVEPKPEAVGPLTEEAQRSASEQRTKDDLDVAGVAPPPPEGPAEGEKSIVSAPGTSEPPGDSSDRADEAQVASAPRSAETPVARGPETLDNAEIEQTISTATGQIPPVGALTGLDPALDLPTDGGKQVASAESSGPSDAAPPAAAGAAESLGAQAAASMPTPGDPPGGAELALQDPAVSPDRTDNPQVRRVPALRGSIRRCRPRNPRRGENRTGTFGSDRADSAGERTERIGPGVL